MSMTKILALKYCSNERGEGAPVVLLVLGIIYTEKNY
jgi:hypothetical protein